MSGEPEAAALEPEHRDVGRRPDREVTVRDGKVVYDLNGLSRPDWKSLPADYRRMGGRPLGWTQPSSCKEMTMAKSNQKLETAPAVAGGGRDGPRRAQAPSGDARQACEEGVLRQREEAGENAAINGVVMYGNMVFISGISTHFEGDIKAHTKHI